MDDVDVPQDPVQKIVRMLLGPMDAPPVVVRQTVYVELGEAAPVAISAAGLVGGASPLAWPSSFL